MLNVLSSLLMCGIWHASVHHVFLVAPITAGLLYYLHVTHGLEFIQK